ncbi:hypothetical protein ACRS2I_12715 [Pseudomonas aeruginosa]|uniref:hypothetical protein n=1 Tax=Pseudomonas aeruginosa TaxID=287 RepID=UPI003EE2679A
MSKKTDFDLLQDPKWLGTTSDELEEGLLCALDGELYSERCLIEYFYERMTAGQSYDLSVLERYLTEVFRQTLERTGDKEDTRLLLRRRRGRPEDPGIIERGQCLSAAALLCIRQGTTWEAACNDVADRYGGSERQVQRALEKHREVMEKLLDTELHALVEGFVV